MYKKDCTGTFTMSSTFLEVFTRLINNFFSVSRRLCPTAQEYQLYLPIFSKRADKMMLCYTYNRYKPMLH